MRNREAQEVKTKSAEEKKRWWLIPVIIALIALVIFILILTQNKDRDKAPTVTMPEAGYVENGLYQVGKDIPAGDYVLFGDWHYSGFNLYKDGKKDIDSLITSEFLKIQLYISLEDGDLIEIEEAKAYPVADAPSTAPDGNPEQGMYLIGKDIPAGEYVIKDSSFPSQYSLYKDITYKDLDDREWVKVRDDEEITLTDGEYIHLDGAQLIIE